MPSPPHRIDAIFAKADGATTTRDHGGASDLVRVPRAPDDAGTAVVNAAGMEQRYDSIRQRSRVGAAGVD